MQLKHIEVIAVAQWHEVWANSQEIECSIPAGGIYFKLMEYGGHLLVTMAVEGILSIKSL